MPEYSPKTLNCPSCGAPLEFDGSVSYVKCKFCQATALIPGLQAQQSLLTPAALAEIRSLAQGGNLLEAIRRYRQLANVSLKEASDAVDMLSSGFVGEAQVVFAGPLSAEQTSRILEEVQDLLRAENKVEAIRRYREAMDVSLTKAKSVVDRVEAALKGLPLPPAPEIPGTISFPQPQVQARRRSSLGAIITLVAVLFVGGLLALIFFAPGGPFSPMLIANGPAALSAAGSGDQRLAVAFYNGTSETYQVGMLEAAKGKLLWLADPIPGNGYVDAVFQAEGLVFVASQANLLAYDGDDGSLVWQALMPDRLNYSPTSLLVTNGRVLTNNADGSLHAYDTSSGTQVWERRLEGYDRSLRLVSGSLLLFDYAADNYTYRLFFLDPLDGSEQRVLTPACQTDEYSSDTLDPSSGFLFDLGDNSVYLVYDSSPGCIQRLDLTSAQPVWQTLDDEWYSFSSGFAGLLTEENLFFSIGNQVLSVDKSSGSLKTLLADEDNDLLPLAVTGDTLVIRLRRTRGTEHFELRGLDASSGRLLWQKDMGEARPIDPPDEMAGLVDEGYPGFTWHLGADALLLLQFQAVPNQLIIQTIDPSNGNLTREIIVPLKAVRGDFYSVPDVIAWEGDLVYLSLDGMIFCVNTLTGEVIFSFQ